MIQRTINAKQHFHSLALSLLLIITSPTAYSLSNGSSKLVEEFLNKQQLNTISYLENNLTQFRGLHSCLIDAKTCRDNLLITENYDIDYDQESLIDFITFQHQRLRFLIGLHSHRFITKSFNTGLKTTWVRPSKLVGRHRFEIRSITGQKEWDQIQQAHRGEMKEIEYYNQLIQIEDADLEAATPNAMKDLLQQQMGEMVQKFPFLKFLRRSQVDKEDIITAINKVMKSYIQSLSHVVSLKDDQRYELFGFFAALNNTLEELPEDQVQKIETHFRDLESQKTLWNQVKGVITNPSFLAVLGCWATSSVVLPLAAVCGALGLSLLVPNVYHNFHQGSRLFWFQRTGRFDQQVHTQHLTSFGLDLLMNLIIARASVPGFVTSVRSFKNDSKRLRRSLGVIQRAPAKYTGKVLKKEWGVMKGYLKYYAKDFGSQETANALLSGLGGTSLKNILPGWKNVVNNALNDISKRPLRLIFYSDFLHLRLASLDRIT